MYDLKALVFLSKPFSKNSYEAITTTLKFSRSGFIAVYSPLGFSNDVHNCIRDWTTFHFEFPQKIVVEEFAEQEQSLQIASLEEQFGFLGFKPDFTVSYVDLKLNVPRLVLGWEF